jgi:hypothetical protein
MDKQTIPSEFTKYGSSYRLIERKGRVVLYELSRKGKPDGFEVMVVQHRKPVELGGRIIPGGEALPSTSLWGVFGWSYLPTQRAEASHKFARTCKHFNVRKLVRHK